MILLIDNYDSFVFNLARYARELGGETQVVRNDALTVSEIEALRPAAIILSPGPCTPAEAGICVEVVRRLGESTPILGVCLGHQAIAEAYGGTIARAPELVHGRSSSIEHDGAGLFAGLPRPLVVGRYHSLIVQAATLPAELRVTARTPEGLIMGLAHARHPVAGVQFHPESILTQAGHELLRNFLELAGIASGPAPQLEYAPSTPPDDFYQWPIADQLSPPGGMRLSW